MASNGSPPAPPYQPSPIEAEYNALKRTYLSLLPPAQIIDICLTFEAYVPVHVRGTVWPYDLKNSIATLLAANSSSTTPPIHDDARKSPQLIHNGSTNHGPPPMLSLKDSALSSSVSTGTTPSIQGSQAQGSSSAQSPASTSTIPPQSQYHPYTSHSQQPAYPHAPYYPPAQHPHSPYYPQPPSYPPYPPHNLPYNPTSLPGVHSQLQQPNYTPPPFTRPPLTRPDGTPAEDLPSYEEMIVEALTEYTEPEGAAPKDLFAWMAARYPLQTNFRPSASQALQKAFKRGRLEKRSNGKYRLNVNWEGGTTSRRNTRRPQTQAVLLMQHSVTPSPFTAEPLPTDSSSASGQTIPAPYAYGYPGYPHQKPPVLPVLPPASEHDDVGEGSDAWEAAQNILKAINFGNYLQQTPLNPSEQLQKTHQTPSTLVEPHSSVSMLIDPQLTSQGESAENVLRRDRAGLQAELALLAAQLARLAESDSDELGGTSADVTTPRA